MSKGRLRAWKRAEVRPLLLERDGDCCQICGLPLGEDMTIDHFVPVSQGGTNRIENLRLTHRLCDKRKRDRAPREGAPRSAHARTAR